MIDRLNSIRLDRDWSTPMMTTSLLGLWSILIAETLVEGFGAPFATYPVLFCIAILVPQVLVLLELLASTRLRDLRSPDPVVVLLGIDDGGTTGLRPVLIDLLVFLAATVSFLRPLRSVPIALLMTALVLWRLLSTRHRRHSPFLLLERFPPPSKLPEPDP